MVDVVVDAVVVVDEVEVVGSTTVDVVVVVEVVVLVRFDDHVPKAATWDAVHAARLR